MSVKNKSQNLKKTTHLSKITIVFVICFRYDVDEVKLVLDNVKHLVKLHDVAGQESYDRLRNLMYLYVS